MNVLYCFSKAFHDLDFLKKNPFFQCFQSHVYFVRKLPRDYVPLAKRYSSIQCDLWKHSMLRSFSLQVLLNNAQLRAGNFTGLALGYIMTGFVTKYTLRSFRQEQCFHHIFTFSRVAPSPFLKCFRHLFQSGFQGAHILGACESLNVRQIYFGRSLEIL